MMFHEAIVPVAGVTESDALLAPMLAPTPTAAPAASFGTWFSNELAAVNDKLVGTERDMQKLAVGAPLNLHETMIRMEEARLSFQLLAKVRNSLLEAYQEVAKMQV